MRRRTPLHCASSVRTPGRRCALLALAAAACAPREAEQRPVNIVVIVADDLGHGDVGWLGGDVPTPWIDSLFAGGVGVTDGYATAAVCVPSRASLLTGRYSQRWGQELNWHDAAPDGSRPADRFASQTTLAEILAGRGYATCAIGKWHLGLEPGQHPLERGFDSFFGHDKGALHLDPTRADVETVTSSLSIPLGPTFRDRAPVQIEGSLTRAHVSEACAFLEGRADEPFFLYLSLFLPHAPYQVDREHYDRHPRFEHPKRIYAGMLAELDDAVGSVLGQLEESGHAEDTLVVFLSDNGAPESADVDGRRNGALTGHKGTLYEGGLRVPLAFSWKGRISPAAWRARPVSSLDLVPTALAAAGVDPAPYDFDGANLFPDLLGERAQPLERSLFWRAGANRAARAGRWKLLRTGEGRSRLFDLEADPGEATDLSPDHPDVTARLESELAAWESELAPACVSTRTRETRQGADTIRWHL